MEGDSLSHYHHTDQSVFLTCRDPSVGYRMCAVAMAELYLIELVLISGSDPEVVLIVEIPCNGIKKG